MRALDTNVLVHAEMLTSPFHTVARDVLSLLANGPAPWAIPWPCVYEFLRVVTHPRVYHPPMPSAAAMKDLRRILGSPSLVLLGETLTLRSLLFAGLVALCVWIGRKSQVKLA